MAYKIKLAHRIREALSDVPNIEEKEMTGGLTFMVNNKMCVGIIKKWQLPVMTGSILPTSW